MNNNGASATGSYYIHTFGCQMNVHDSEYLAGILETLGYQAAACEEEADIIFLNTCSVREKADQKLFTKLGRVRLMKRANPNLIVGVSGCIAQREGERLFDRAPHTDIVLGTRAISRLPVLLEELRQKRDSGGGGVSFLELTDDLPGSAVFVRGSKAVAYVTIMEGCDNFCSYCIVPLVRGREISRPAESILEEVRQLAEKGYVEVQLLGQNVNSYRDENAGFDFAALLDEVARVGGISRLRFITSHPKDFDESIAAVMAQHDNICSAIHLPPQSGSDRILKAMSRKYTRKEYLNKVEVLKDYLKNVSISGDFICGFPGESEEDFKLSLDLAGEVGFSQLFTFIYSPRPGTKAESLDDDVSRGVKVDRLQHLQELQLRIQRKKHERLVGTIEPVLIEGESARGGGQLCGRTEGNLVVNLTAPRELIGKIVSVEIGEAGGYSLGGRIAGSP